MNEAQRRQALGDFLRTRRSRIFPTEVGLPAGKRRRTPGLRREEVAQLANIGVSWYTSLEQGRDIHPSTEILSSIATALQLTFDERQHLFLLADMQRFHDELPLDEYISPALRRILEDLNPDPAYVMGRRWDYLAWNTAAEQVFTPSRISLPYAYNIVWRIFGNSERQSNDPDWEQKAQGILAEFRAESVQYADEEWFKQLIADLQQVSPEFRAWWPRHDVRGRLDGRKNIEHPVVGSLLFEHVTLQVPSNSHLKVMIYTPLPGTKTSEKLQFLLSSPVATEASPH
ncbi:helix-turn-helix transcriptional regulator [Tengunoibacter tsumagoiensis]|uniref:Transcriptional regulator n=1 Tax=Tengunoibacter tsumagoiensis TaxID=2014871 RepID=A0A401ZV81_9CHLR|nr:helix-turn-helix transcriptional regulator [Tengunoibacter tsumagoiensis]GCE10696.1 transcriptional regulator [Tengunoibacter tsumagoiensis]